MDKHSRILRCCASEVSPYLKEERMARKKAQKTEAASGSNAGGVAEDEGQKTPARVATKGKRAGSTRRGAKAVRRVKRARKGPEKVAQPARARRGRQGRTRYTEQQRQHILSTAEHEGLTALAVQKRFGVTPVTYYSWRKKGGVGRKRRERAVAAGAAVGKALAGTMNLADMIRHELRTHIHKILPEMVRSEVGSAVSGTTKRRRR
jgi:hypothetical protein